MVAVPGDHVVGRVILRRLVERPAHLGRDAVADGETILGPGAGGPKMAGVGQAVRAERAALGQRETTAEHLRQVAARFRALERHREADAARNERKLPGCDVQHAELREQGQRAALGQEQ